MPPAARDLTANLKGRDLTLDLARVVCLLTVVAAHVCFVALRTSADGGIENWTPPQALAYFAPGTWFIQPMPLFFVIGGCVSLLAWRKYRSRGEDAFAYLRIRLLRFVQPAAAFFVILGVVFGAAVLLGVPIELANTAAYGVGTPLWFMGAYLLCQAMLPVLAAGHQRHPVLMLVLLAGAAVVVDVVRVLVGNDVIGLLNYLFVWPFAQQLGFWLADGRLRLRRWQLVVGWVVAMTATGVIATSAPYGPDMLQNQIPPTVPLMTMAVAHTCLFQLIRPLLARLATVRPVLAVMALIGSRGMTVYIWHAGLVIAIAAGFYFVGLPQAPGAAWWLTRPLVFVAVLGLVLVISLPLARLERGPDPAVLPSTGRVGVRVAIVVAGAIAVIPAFLTINPTGTDLLRGLDLVRLWVGAGLLIAALALLRVLTGHDEPHRNRPLPYETELG